MVAFVRYPELLIVKLFVSLIVKLAIPDKSVALNFSDNESILNSKVALAGEINDGLVLSTNVKLSFAEQLLLAGCKLTSLLSTKEQHIK